MKMNNLINKTDEPVLAPFEWKQAGERGFLRIDQMATSHLYNVLRMIWNHTAPEPMRLTPFKRYNFSSFYTPEYMAEAVRAMVAELKTRTNINSYERVGLTYMALCLSEAVGSLERIE